MSCGVISEAEAAMREEQMTIAYGQLAILRAADGIARSLSGDELRAYVLKEVQAVSLQCHIATVNDMTERGQRPPDEFLEAAVAILDRAVARAVDIAMDAAS